MDKKPLTTPALKSRRRIALGIAMASLVPASLGLCRLLTMPHQSAPLSKLPLRFEPELWTRLPAQAGACGHWQPDGSAIELSPELVEISGIASSRIYRNIFYHINDSGNDPLLYVTDERGDILQKIRYANKSSDTEALSQGPCPWGGSCLFVADTGDNFHWRSARKIIALDERSLFSDNVRSQELNFSFPNAEKLDVEALAVQPQTGDMYLFSKERKKSRVFLLAQQAWQLVQDLPSAELLGEIPKPMVTDANFSDDGKRLLLINLQGVFERSMQALAGTQASQGWWPFERNLGLPRLMQQEAVAYLSDQRSVVYSSEKKSYRSGPWGLVFARCQPLSNEAPHPKAQK